MKVADFISKSIQEYPSLYKDVNYEKSKMKVLDHVFFTIGNGMEIAEPPDGEAGGYVVSPKYKRDRITDEWVRRKDKPYGKEKYKKLPSDYFDSVVYYVYGSDRPLDTIVKKDDSYSDSVYLRFPKRSEEKNREPRLYKAESIGPFSPYRIAEYGTCYRYEQSGELFGLMRVRCLHMNDAHIYCNKEQFAAEFRAVNDMYTKYFKIFGIDKYVMRLSLHDPAKLGAKYVNEPELWKETEAMVRQVLIESEIPYIEVQDEAAFYGPKIDVQIWSAIGREFTLATNQVDFNSGNKFKLSYVNQNNQPEVPLIIHRAPLGTHERFIGFLLEHYAGKFPVWLAPLQVKILPISDKFMEFAEGVKKQLKASGVRVEIDDRSEKIGKKIRDTELQRVPYMLVVGEKETLENKLSVRRQGKGDLGMQDTQVFIDAIIQEIHERKSGE